MIVNKVSIRKANDAAAKGTRRALVRNCPFAMNRFPCERRGQAHGAPWGGLGGRERRGARGLL